MVQEGWHIAKSVPATLLLGLITQAGAIVWTVSHDDGRHPRKPNRHR